MNKEQCFKTDDANSYNEVVDYFDKYTERFTSHMPGPMVSMAAIKRNDQVLDIGTGTGVIALDVASRLSNNGKVVGIDLSDGMLSVATDKAKDRRLSNRTEFLKMDAENLSFKDNLFDSALTLYALRHFPNPGQSVKEIYRVLKPGGRIVAAVGSPPPLLSIYGFKAAFRRIASVFRKITGRELSACEFIDELVAKHIPERKDRDVAEWVEHQHEFTGSVKGMLENAGFVNLETDWKGQYSIVESIEDFWLLQMTFSSIARKRVQEADVETVKILKDEFYKISDKVLKKGGRLVYQTGAAIVSGTK